MLKLEISEDKKKLEGSLYRENSSFNQKQKCSKKRHNTL